MIYNTNDLNNLPDNSLLKMIGDYIKHQRLQQNRSQDIVATEACISRSTLSLLERGEKVKTDTLIKVLRVLNLLHILEIFAVTEQISPLEYAKLKKKQQRLHASAQKTDYKTDKEDLGW